MTKKFWEDWKKRYGDTKMVYLNEYKFADSSYYIGKYIGGTEEVLTHFDFKDDAIKITFITLYNHNKETITLNRTDIRTVKFKKLRS